MAQQIQIFGCDLTLAKTIETVSYDKSNFLNDWMGLVFWYDLGFLFIFEKKVDFKDKFLQGGEDPATFLQSNSKR